MAAPQTFRLTDIRRERYRRSLYEFVKAFWHIVEPAEAFVDGPHLKAICDHVQAWIEGRIKNLSVEIGPGYGKSLIGSVFSVAWAWGPRGMPQLRFGSSTYEHGLTVRDSIRCRELIQHPEYQALWAHVFKLVEDNNKQHEYHNNRKGFRLSMSTKGKTTGHRFHRFIGDDLMNAAEAHSESEQAQVLKHWRAVATRGVNNRTYGRMIIGQRLADSDAGSLARKYGFEVLCLPTEYDPDRHCSTSIGWTDWRSVRGELLFPARIGPDDVVQLKFELGPYDYPAQHNQLVVPVDGGVLKRTWVLSRPSRARSFYSAVLQSVDTSFADEKAKGDDSAIITIGLHNDGVDILDAKIYHLQMPQLLDAIKAEAKRWRPFVVLIEAKANGLSIIHTLEQSNEFPFSIEKIVPSISKNSRAHAAAPFVSRRLLSAPATEPWANDLLDTLDVFPAGKRRDAADALVQAVLYINEHYRFSNHAASMIQDLPKLNSQPQHRDTPDNAPGFHDKPADQQKPAPTPPKSPMQPGWRPPAFKPRGTY